MNKFTVVIAAVIGFHAGTRADAGISLNFKDSNGLTSSSSMQIVDGGKVVFNPDSEGNTFLLATPDGGSGVGYQSAYGLHGKIVGEFHYTSVTTSPDGQEEFAVLDDTDGIANELHITDRDGNELVAVIEGINLHRQGVGGALNWNSTVNISNVTYTGTNLNQDLVQFRDEAVAGGGAIASITFQIKPESLTLASLLADSTLSTNSSTFSGVISTVPEPGSMALAFTGVTMLGLGYYRQQRRKLV